MTSSSPSPALAGARILLTGASCGIGQATAQALAEAGADLALNGRHAEGLQDVAAQVVAEGRGAHLLPGDLRDPGAPARLVEAAATSLGGLDALIHIAGAYTADAAGQFRMAPLLRSRDEDWSAALAVNFTAALQLCRSAHPHLVRSPQPSVLLMSSAVGLMGAPAGEAYAMTKAAQVSLVRSLAVAWGPQHIRVNAVCPGIVDTGAFETLEGDEELSHWLLSRTPLGRWASVHDVAQAVLFLTCPAAGFITGQALAVDGGMSVPGSGFTAPDIPAFRERGQADESSTPAAAH
ncbi:gluconate 5-dehydrogenase [Streptomyces chrestomyceticus JCM 4735]|uniref:Gluconate 5-dehydrogenase n=1 Tax=Streptomyces chrestomyceticus JCM 4735 TaxID=1306181 RepID=A0A7U9KUL2_9ACTN|nr:SDR family NAD(P)-dependent oxidoreductase [Streptomyces chrestomyceticus]GCD35659.1 gluconate 5-dehydrogenase [Streptomyces chrestomyceticus JCM 4735]